MQLINVSGRTYHCRQTICGFPWMHAEVLVFSRPYVRDRWYLIITQYHALTLFNCLQDQNGVIPLILEKAPLLWQSSALANTTLGLTLQER